MRSAAKLAEKIQREKRAVVQKMSLATRPVCNIFVEGLNPFSIGAGKMQLELIWVGKRNNVGQFDRIAHINENSKPAS